MRRIVLSLIAILLFGLSASAQTNNAASKPGEAAAAQLTVRPIPAVILQQPQALHATLKPAAATWVSEQAKNESHEAVPDLDELRDLIRKRFANSLPGGAHPAVAASGQANNVAIEEMVMIVMMEAAQDADNDLRTQMQQMQALTKAKDQIRAVLNDMSQPMSALAGGQRNAPCETEFCKSLPSKLSAINAATANLPHPSYLPVPAKMTAEDVANAQAALQNDLDSDNDISQMTQLQLQMLMDRREKMLEALSNIEKKMSDTDSAIVSNLK